MDKLVFDKVTLRKMTEKDTANVVRWRNSPSVVENFIFRTPLTEESHLQWYRNKVLTGQVAQFIIEDNETGFDVGSVYLRDIDNENKKCEYGIFIGEESCRGKGLGTAAAKAILDYAFTELGMNRVFLRVFAKNAAAINSYKRAGFKEEGVFRQDVIIDGIPYDMVFMAVLFDDWKKGV